MRLEAGILCINVKYSMLHNNTSGINRSSFYEQLKLTYSPVLSRSVLTY